MGSASGKGEQRGVVPGVGRLQGGDISLPHRCGINEAGIDEAAATPGETKLPQSLDDQIGHQAGVAAVTVRKKMDGDHAMMKAHRNFVGRKGGVLDLVLNVVL